MLVRLLLILLIVLAVVWFVLRRQNVRISLTPLGKTALARAVLFLVRLILRRFFP